MRNWDSYREIWEINKDAFIRRYAKLKPALSTFDADINRYNEVANNTQKEETLTNINFVRLDCSPLKHSLVSHCSAWQNKLTTLLNTNAINDLKSLHDMFNQKTVKLKAVPKDLNQLCDSLALLTQLNTDIPSIEAQFQPIFEEYQILEKYEVAITEEEKLLLENLQPNWQIFQVQLQSSAKELQEYKSKFKSELMNSVDEFTRTIANIKDEFNSKGPFHADFGVPEALSTIEEFKIIMADHSATEATLKKGLLVFKIEQSPNKDVELITTQLQSLSTVWSLTEEWNGIWRKWKTQPFLSLVGAELEDTVQRFLKRFVKLPKEMKDIDVFVSLREKVNQTKRSIPLLLELTNSAFRERHWSKLMEEIGKSFDPYSKEFTLEKILDLGLDQYSESISALSAAATKEFSIEVGIKEIETAWNALDLDVVPYKDDKKNFKLRSTDALFELLENNQVSLSSMKSSKFFLAFEKQVDTWERSLNMIVEIIEVLMTVQRSWMYLENIFIGTEDIRKQLPKESAIFDSVNLSWREIMTRMNEDKNALRASRHPNLHETLFEMNEKLEKVQRSLDMYLETKRMSFPRFYFLSNDDLLEILGQAKDPNAIQQHLKKCFDNLTKLELFNAGTETRKRYEATGMHSGDGEFVPFQTPVALEGPVELWLNEIESSMRVTLRRLMFGTLVAMKKVKKDKWLKEWPGMLLIVSGLINWTSECTKALQDIEKGEKSALKDLKKHQVSNLKRYSDLVKLPLSKVERKKLIALITIEVHSRDVIDKMAKVGCENVQAFDWLSQLRFYWEKDAKDSKDEDCFIRQINTQFRFGYEYLGNSGRLVITPLTDRCYMTLTTALHLHRGGSPQGPAGNFI